MVVFEINEEMHENVSFSLSVSLSLSEYKVLFGILMDKRESVWVISRMHSTPYMNYL